MEGGNIVNVEKEEHTEEENNKQDENKEDEHNDEDSNDEDSNDKDSNDEDTEANNILNGGGKKKTKNEEQDLENPARKLQDLENPARKLQDLENPARKLQDLENPARKFSSNIKEDMTDSTDTNDIEYTIDYLIEDDEKLINSDNVKKQVDTYIDNYNSDSMKKYTLSFNRLYQKYSNKKYKIKIVPVNDKYKSTKIVVVKNDKKEDDTTITELIKPHYIYYNDDTFNLYDFKNKVSNARAELLYKYELLVSKINISPEEKTNFEKERNKFIKLLEDYYSYTLYHKKINKISTLNTTHLIIQSKYNIHNDNNDNDMMSSSSILTGESYIINNTIINSINTNNIDKLTQYNDIIMQLTGKNSKEIKKDTKLIEEIKLYLNKNEKEKLNKQIEESKSHQDTYINYIVSRLPIV